MVADLVGVPVDLWARVVDFVERRACDRPGLALGAILFDVDAAVADGRSFELRELQRQVNLFTGAESRLYVHEDVREEGR